MRATNAATRHGCVVLSLDICELQLQQPEQIREQAGATATYQSTRDAVLSWLQLSLFADRLPDGTVLNVQVCLLVYEIC